MDVLLLDLYPMIKEWDQFMVLWVHLV